MPKALISGFTRYERSLDNLLKKEEVVFMYPKLLIKIVTSVQLQPMSSPLYFTLTIVKWRTLE